MMILIDSKAAETVARPPPPPTPSGYNYYCTSTLYTEYPMQKSVLLSGDISMRPKGSM